MGISKTIQEDEKYIHTIIMSNITVNINEIAEK